MWHEGIEEECIQSFGGKLEGKGQFRRPWRRWEDNITATLRQLVWESNEWINLAQDWYMWWSLVNAVTKRRVAQNFLTS